ncbi:PRD domain-containing protein [Saccharibacillus sp. CPCC 101409]|uniref:BglG family transcription antiterminator n=1 Tax=Saccharibacillus sp. CPCC 101409 TaxID=3058041 RepID=UPI0026734958|nr:PRD domain-containing protein [Saccharibacillus sp. CPCC 101409]MDO3409771.1 PRD domain-containing protein [Saccharibacillus sp. CPCC 101409]
MTLSVRSRALLKKILQVQYPLRIKHCADEFQVSERMIKYDLEAVRIWLREENIEVQSKSSVGIWIDCEDEERTQLLAKLEDSAGRVFMNQLERVRCAILDLMMSDSPLTIGELMKRNQVTRSTTQSDLLLTEEFLGRWELRIERSRLGLEIVGAENRKRTALESVVQDSVDGSDLFEIVQGAARRQAPPHYSIVLERFWLGVPDGGRIFNALGRLVEELDRQLGVLLSDRVIVAVFIRLCIAVQRREYESALPPEDPESERLIDGLKGHAVFRRILSEAPEEWGFSMSDEAIRYISLQATMAIAPGTGGAPSSGFDSSDTFEIVRSLLREVGERTGVSFEEDMQLFNALLARVAEMLNKHSYGVVEPHPLLQEILRSYRAMFEHVKEAGAIAFAAYDLALNDSDVASLALLFQTAYERRDELPRYRAAVVCGTGMGTSALLKTLIEKEIPMIHVAAVCSIMELGKVLDLDRYDLIVSVFPLSNGVSAVPADVPVVVVNAIPGRPDFLAIRSELKRIEEAGSAPRGAGTPESYPAGGSQSTLAYRFQNIIFKGYTLSKQIIDRFGERLSPERADGLTLHLLYMMNRIAFGTEYRQAEEFPAEPDLRSPAEAALREILEEHHIQINSSEIEAILRYLE